MQVSTLIIVALVFIVVLNLLIVAATLAAKALRSRKSRQTNLIRERIEPALYEYLIMGEIPSVLREAREKNPNILSAMIVELLAVLRGNEHEKIVSLAGELGLVGRDYRFLRSRNRWKKARAAENLGYYGGPDATEPLSELLHDEDETVRAVAARALSRIGTPEAAEALADRLNSASELTSLRMAENLERIGPLAKESLLSLIESQEEEDRRGQVLAARIMSNLRVQEARPALCRAIRRPWNTDLRAQATLALGRIGDPDDVPTILEATRDNSWPVRAQAANALDMIGDTSAIPALEDLMVDREWWVRLNASRALANMGTRGEQALARVLENPDRYARDRAAAIMENRGFTRRMVSEMSDAGERARSARKVIRRLIENGTTRHLGYLARTLPESGERQDLREMLVEAYTGPEAGSDEP